jgi:hypothetical protein
VTDSSDPRRRSSRSSSRKPPTIDLKATVVDEGARAEARDPEATAVDEGASAAAGDPKTAAADEGARAETRTAEEGTTPAEAERAEAVRDAMLEGGPADAPPAEPDHAAPDSAARDSSQDPASEPAAAARPEVPRSRGPGLSTIAGAGLLGGLVGAGAVLAVQAWRPVSPPPDPRVSQIERQIAALPRPDNAALDRRLAAVESAQSGLAQRAQAAEAAADRAAARAEEAMNRPLPVPSPAAPAPDDAAMAELAGRLGQVEAQLREQAQAASGERQGVRESAEAAARAAQGLADRVNEQGRLANEQGQRVSALEERIADLAREAAEGGGEVARAGMRLVLANRLDAALKEGAAYQDVLAGLRRLGTDAALIAPLEPFAQGGAPSAAALAQSFKPLGRRIAAESRPAAPAAPAAESWTDRLLDLAGRVVTIRAVDAPRGPDAQAPGGTAGASAAQVEEALARGDLAAASAAWDALPEPARALSADWGRQLKQRAAAEAASRALAANAVAALNSPTR